MFLCYREKSSVMDMEYFWLLGIWVAVKGVGQRSNLILFRKITVLGVWWMVWRGTG